MGMRNPLFFTLRGGPADKSAILRIQRAAEMNVKLREVEFPTWKPQPNNNGSVIVRCFTIRSHTGRANSVVAILPGKAK
jgi:hypothetical protein